MASLAHARTLNPDDGAVLRPIDQHYAIQHDLEPMLTRGSLSFYARSGHSFVAVKDHEVTGFVLAQAVWNGTRPTVYLNRLVAGDDESRLALLEAVTKSAYDAAVYDLHAQVPTSDEPGLHALLTKEYAQQPLLTLTRILGDRGA